MKQKPAAFVTLIGLITVLMTTWLTTGFAGAKDQTPTAEQILAQARGAIGGETALQAIQSLSVSVKFRRALPFPGEPEMTGENEFSFLLPDKYMNAETLEPPGGLGGLTKIDVLNGDQVWMDVRSSGPGMVAGFFAHAGDDKQFQAIRVRELRHEFARHLLSLLLAAPPSFPIAWSYAGEAEGDEARAWVLDAKGPDDFAIRLFIDQKTYLPMMMSYHTRAGLMAVGTAVAPGAGVKAVGGDVVVHHTAPKSAGKGHGAGVPSSDTAPMLAPPGEEKEVEIQTRFSDYRAVDGILLPHRFTRATEGEADGEWEIIKYKINPPLSPEKFQQKRKG